jgi:hypothetical protein
MWCVTLTMGSVGYRRELETAEKLIDYTATHQPRVHERPSISYWVARPEITNCKLQVYNLRTNSTYIEYTVTAASYRFPAV